jgi:hypothetical protein
MEDEPDNEVLPRPDNEDFFLEAMGMAPDGSAMMIGDESILDGRPWEPDPDQGLW